MADLIFKNGEDIKPKDFKNLTENQQLQLYLTVEGSEEKLKGKNILKALQKVWRESGGELCEFWQVAAESNPEQILYDFWFWNADTGLVFFYNTTQSTHIAMIQYYFDRDIAQEDDALEALIYDLNEAFKRKRKFRKGEELLQWSDNEEIIDFAKPEYIPNDNKKWNHILKEHKVTEGFIRKYQAHFNKKSWELIGEYSILSEGFMRAFVQKLDWNKVSRHQKLSENFIRDYPNQLNWKNLCYYQVLSEAFILEFEDKIDWEWLSCKQTFTEDFMRKYQDKLDWEGISWSQQLSEDFMREFGHKLDWDSVLAYQQVSEAYLRKIVRKATWNNWYYINKHQKLSLQFIQDYAKKIDWGVISMNKHLSEEIIEVYKDKIVWSTLAYFNANTEKILTEKRLLELREMLPQKRYWKDIFVHLHHISKQFKADFLKNLQD